ncbi:MAG: NIPSNAP family containing protein [Cyclobacteriaceae bacterium]|nr:NIPSNAP family containing protein [Cyclobacteriaceae bacterium]
MKKSSILIFLFSLITCATLAAPSREYYELRTYRFTSIAQQERVETYLQKALLPSLHRLGIKRVGVFKPVETDSTYGKKLIALIPFRSFDDFESMAEKLAKDKQYLEDGKDYIDAVFDNPPYARIETIILKAFSEMPISAVPDLKLPVNERIYELRSYEGHTEKIYRNKVQMFNAGDEVGLFKRLGFNAVFYGEVLAGSTMPNLMYMTSFENQASRDEHWKAFGQDPQWKKLSSMPEYQHNVSKNVTRFFRPTSYSDI